MPNTRVTAPRSLPLGVPPRGWLLSGWALLPLRAFLAFTFLFAGLQKLSTPSFFDKSSESGIYAQMLGAERSSPIHFLLGHLLRYSTPLGIAIALGELAIGLGIALGLWTRLAAIGGMLISLSLFLTVSWHASPWYTGADIVYVFMFTPLLIAGAGGVLSLDAMIARRVASESALDPPEQVVVAFAQVQRACGSYDDGRCTAVAHRHCAPAGCPYLEGGRTSLPGGRGIDRVDRRSVVLGGVAAVAAATTGLLVAGAAAGIGQLADPDKSVTGPTLPSDPTGSTGVSTKGTLLGPAADVPVGQAANFTTPQQGLVIQESAGKFVAYSSICPHAGCIVAYSPAANVIACPCHGSQFQVSNGDVIVGPATVGLTPLDVADDGGQLYIKA